jgi:hypothetical protein
MTHRPARSVSIPEVWTSLPDAVGSDRVYLSQLGQVSALRYSSSYPGGPKALSCLLAVEALFTHRAFAPGRDCGVTVGGEDVWKGTLNASPPGDDGGRQISADGDAVTTARFVALGLGTHNALNANEVIDAAAVSGRHSRFTRDATLPVPDGVQAKDAAFMMDEALTQNANASAKRWRVDPDRVIRYYPTVGTGDVVRLHARHDPGRTLDGQVTRLDAAYIDALTGLYNVEHLDADPSETGSTVYPQFYLPDGSAYSARNFTLYLAGGVLTAYVIRAPATADTMHLTSPAATLTLVRQSGVYAQFSGPAPGGLVVGATGRAATYTAGAGPSLGGGTQDDAVQAGIGSLDPTGNIPPREQVIDLTSQGAFTMAEVNEQLKAYLAKTKVQPHYNGPFTAAPGDLRNSGDTPVDLATVQAGVQVLVLVTDPARSLDLQADVPLVTVGEVEYDVDTSTLTLTPAESPVIVEQPRYIDPASGLAR